MKYRPNQPKSDFAKALYLSKDQERRLINAINKVFDQIESNGNKDYSVDEINSLIAPYIKTTEEAYFCAQNIMIAIFRVQGQHILNGFNQSDINVN